MLKWRSNLETRGGRKRGWDKRFDAAEVAVTVLQVSKPCKRDDLKNDAQILRDVCMICLRRTNVEEAYESM